MHMQLHELLDSGVLLEMAYTQKKAERVITGLEKPINDHLLKLWTTSDSFDHRAWTDNLVNWIDEIGEIVLRPTNARPPHIFYYKLLFFEPFGGGAEIPNLLRRLRRLQREGIPGADRHRTGSLADAPPGVSPRSRQPVGLQTDAGRSNSHVFSEPLERFYVSPR